MKKGAIRSQASSVAEGTFDNYINHWVNYLEFCIYFSLAAFPAQATTLMWFVQYLSDKVKSHRTIQGAVSAINKLHKILRVDNNAFSDYIFQMTMSGLQRLNTHISKQAAPMTPKLLEQIHGQLDLNNVQDAVFWAVCIFGFFLLFRKSNLIPDTKNGFDSSKQLSRGDVAFTQENIVVGIRWAKNMQFGRNLSTFPLPILPDSVLCPKRAIQKVFELVPGSDDDSLFKITEGITFTYRQFQDKLHRVLAAVPVDDPSSFSSHSFRRGGATFSFLCGVPSEIIKVLGGWKSDVYIQYLHLPVEARIAASRLIKLRLMYNKYQY